MKPVFKNAQEYADDEMNIYPTESRLYHFPDINQLGQEFDSVNEISHKLDILLKNHNQINDKNKIEKTLVTREIEGGYLFKCKVRGCSSLLKFHYTSTGRLMLAKSDIEHEHKMNNRLSKGRLPKIKNSEVEECYDELQLLNFRPGQILNFIRIRFKVSKPHYYAIKYGRNKRETIRNLLMTLSKYDNFYFECKDLQELAAYYRNERLKPEKRQDKDVVIVVSKRMKELYEAYHGEYVLFSIFPELVLETRYTKKLKYHHVGVLYGEDATGCVNLLFGVIFMRKSIRLAYLYIMEKLFTFLGKYPKVLITDYEPHLAQAIRRLQKRIINPQNTIKLHLQLPNSFITNTFQSRTSPQFLSILSNELEGLLRESDRNKHEQRLRVILKACELNPPATQERIADQIRRYVKGNSIIYLPPLFIGLSVTPYSTASYLRTRVLDFFKSPRPMVLAIKAFFEIFQAYPVLKYLTKEQIEARLNPPKECSSKKEKLQLLASVSKTFESSTRLKSISKALSQPAALCFHDSLERCFMGRIELVMTQNRASYRAFQTQETYPYVINRVYQLCGKEKIKVWRCNCHYYAKTGLPCWHEIKVCIEQRSSLIPQINPFWLKGSRLFEKKDKNNEIEHDVKYWNDQEGTKFGFEERQKLQPSFHASKSRNKEENASNGLYNIKAHNQNEQEEEENQPIENFKEKENDGLCALINELQGIEWKEDDEDEQNFLNTWKDPSASKVSERQGSLYYEDEDKNLNFDNESLINSLCKEGRPSNKKGIQPSKHNPLKGLKANNHSQSNNSHQNNSSNNSGYRQLNLELSRLDNKDFVSQSSKIWNQNQSNFDMNFNQSQFGSSKGLSYKSTAKNDNKWGMESFEGNEEDHIIDEESPNEKDFEEEENSQQDSAQEWQRKSIDRLNAKSVPAVKKPQTLLIEVSDQDFNLTFEEETERYVPFNEEYYEIHSDEQKE